MCILLSTIQCCLTSVQLNNIYPNLFICFNVTLRAKESAHDNGLIAHPAYETINCCDKDGLWILRLGYRVT